MPEYVLQDAALGGRILAEGGMDLRYRTVLRYESKAAAEKYNFHFGGKQSRQSPASDRGCRRATRGLNRGYSYYYFAASMSSVIGRGILPAAFITLLTGQLWKFDPSVATQTSRDRAESRRKTIK